VAVSEEAADAVPALVPKCYCGREPVRKVCKRSTRGNAGRAFFRCPGQPFRDQCGYFVWEDDCPPSHAVAVPAVNDERAHSSNGCVRQQSHHTSSSTKGDGSSGGSSSEEADISFRIVQRGKLTIYCGETAAGHIDMGSDNMPGLTLYTPSAKATGIEEKSDRQALKDKAKELVSKRKEDKSQSGKIEKLANLIRDEKKAALARDSKLVFVDPKKPVPNESIARLLLHTIGALRETVLPSMRSSNNNRPSTRGGDSSSSGERKAVKTILDSGSTDPMVDRLEVKDNNLEINTKEVNEFSVASGAPFKTDGMTVEMCEWKTTSTDGEPMTFGAQAHVCDMGGSKGRDKSKNLLDIVRTLCMGMKLDLVMRVNKHGMWAGCIIDRRTGMMARVPLDRDLLPCIDRVGGEKFPHPSCPDSLEELCAVYMMAAKTRRARLGRGQARTHNVQPGSDAADEVSDEDSDDYGEWMDEQWEEVLNKRALKNARSRSRTTGKKLVYDAESAHGILHRPAADTRKALNLEGVRFNAGDGSVTKTGIEITEKDLAFGPCHVCKKTRACAPVRHAKGVTNYACADCHKTELSGGATFAAMPQ